MLKQLWNNRTGIISNYKNIIYENRKWITIIIILLFLSFIYALLSIKEYNITQNNKQQLEHFENYIKSLNDISKNEKINNNNILETTNKEIENKILLHFVNLDTYNNSNNNLNNNTTNNNTDNNTDNNTTNNNTDNNTDNINVNKQKDENIIKNLKSWIEIEYLSKMNNVNITARGFINIKDLRNHYMNDLLQPINLDEVNTVQLFFNNNISNYNQHQTKWVNNIISKCKITKSSKWLEMGMPHTHADVIIFNSGFFKNPSWTTFIHECVHIDQRIGLGINKYTELYNTWGFIHYNISRIKGFEAIIIRNRLNPDAIDCNWIWHCKADGNYYWIGAVFNSITPDNLGDVSYNSYKLTKDNRGDFYYNGNDTITLSKWDNFRNYFGNISNNHYHPNEISAEYMGIYFNMNRDNTNNNDTNNGKNSISNVNNNKYENIKNKQGFIEFQNWFNNSN